MHYFLFCFKKKFLKKEFSWLKLIEILDKCIFLFRWLKYYLSINMVLSNQLKEGNS